MSKAAMTSEEKARLDSAIDLVNGPMEGGREGFRLICKALIEPLPYLHLPVDERPSNLDYGDEANVMLRYLADAYDLLTVLRKAKPDRFRRCSREECGKLFYAHHGNKWACTPCAAVVRMRRLRSQPENRRGEAKPLTTAEIIARIEASPSMPRPATYAVRLASGRYLVTCSRKTNDEADSKRKCFYQWQTDNKDDECPRCHPTKPARKNRSKQR